MSYKTRPKPTGMLVCDLCDEEIDKQADGEWSRGNIICNVSPMAQVTNRTKHALLCWPRSRTRRDEERPAADYDFHGKCIADLVDETIKARAAVAEGGGQ